MSNPKGPLDLLTDEELAEFVPLTEEEIKAALDEGRAARDAIEESSSGWKWRRFRKRYQK